MAKQEVKAIILDLDGVITDTESHQIRAFNQVLEKCCKIKIPKKEFLRRFIGTGSKHIFTTVIKEHKLKVKYSYLYKEKQKHVLNALRKKKLMPLPGVMMFIYAAKKRNLKLCVATGGSKAHAKIILRRLKLKLPLVAKEDVRRSKPFPDLFLAAAKKIKVAPKYCVVIEDGLSGLEAAKRAGMQRVAFTTSVSTKELKKKKPLCIVRDFRKIKPENLLKRICPI